MQLLAHPGPPNPFPIHRDSLACGSLRVPIDILRFLILRCRLLLSLSPHPGECSPIDNPYEEDYSKFDVQKAQKSLEDLVQAVAVKPAPKGLPKQVREMYQSFKNAVESTHESELSATAGAMCDFVDYVYGALLEFELLDKK